MIKNQKKIEELKYKLSMIQMADHLYEEDYQTMRELNKQIEELEAEQHEPYWIVELGRGWYLSGDARCCFSDTPCKFRTKKEAFAYLDRAYMDDDDKASASVMRVKE